MIKKFHKIDKIIFEIEGKIKCKDNYGNQSYYNFEIVKN
jgi:hypothetical protein